MAGAFAPPSGTRRVPAADGLEDDRDAVADIDTWQILHDAMDRLTEQCMGNTIDTYKLLGAPHEADGTVETHQDGLCWSVAVAGEFDPDFGEEWDTGGY